MIYQRIKRFEEKGSADLNVAQNEQIDFTAEEWNNFDDMKKQQILMNYRIAYLGETMVNWCPGLGTVLANDEVFWNKPKSFVTLCEWFEETT